VVVVLDAWAVIAMLQAEAAGPRVRDLIVQGDALISWVNLGEVYSELIRREGETGARRWLAEILRSVRAEELDGALVIEAARLKARGGISYADCFAVATARRHRAPLLTGDPEIVALAGDVEVIDLR
jgi:PIN domain nuclease of toxin-antitoxin system